MSRSQQDWPIYNAKHSNPFTKTLSIENWKHINRNISKNRATFSLRVSFIGESMHIMYKLFVPVLYLCIISKCQCCPHIETSQLIFRANQLSSFYMSATLALNGLRVLHIPSGKMNHVWLTMRIFLLLLTLVTNYFVL